MKSFAFGLGVRDPRGGRVALALSVWMVALCLVAAAASGCGGDQDAAEEAPADAAATDQESGATSQASGATDQASGATSQASGATSQAAGDDGAGEASQSSAADSTVATTNQNPSGAGPELDYSRNAMLRFAAPRNAVTWTTAPHFADGALSGAGELPPGVMLFDPLQGQGAPFSVYFADHDEPMVVLLPDLGPTQMWNTDLTVAEMEFELSGTSFSFRAYSPLFMDSAGGDLELRVFGFDSNGSIALLAVATIGE